MVLSDEILIKQINNGDSYAMEELINRYKKLIYFRIHELIYDVVCKMYLFEDLVQSSIVLLYECVYRYNPDKGAKFSTYFNFCLERKIIRECNKYIRKKELYLALSLDEKGFKDGTTSIGDLIESKKYEFRGDYYWAEKELKAAITQVYESLSTEEVVVCERKFEGYSYKEIAEKHNCTTKKVDNTLNKFRTKLLTIINDYDKVN
ncbi:MAG: sigma-70 family RNA polymerase sigma factor [Erysipelotrichaceae bacterium]